MIGTNKSEWVAVLMTFQCTFLINNDNIFLTWFDLTNNHIKMPFVTKSQLTSIYRFHPWQNRLYFIFQGNFVKQACLYRFDVLEWDRLASRLILILKIALTIKRPLTLNVRGPSYLGLTRSISWLLVPWLLTSPGHQQPWYWLCRIGRFLSCLRKDFNYLHRINVEKYHKM